METPPLAAWEVRVVGGVVDGEEDGVELEGVGPIALDAAEMTG